MFERFSMTLLYCLTYLPCKLILAYNSVALMLRKLRASDVLNYKPGTFDLLFMRDK